MTNTPRNPQAYPGGLQPGMTLRDAFAISALPVAWSAYDAGYYDDGNKANTDAVAECAYQIADAMLKAREED